MFDKILDKFFPLRWFSALRGDSYAAGTHDGDWIDTKSLHEPVYFLGDVSAVGAGTATFSVQHTAADGAGNPDAGAATDLEEDFCVLPNHTEASPNLPPTVGSYPAAVAAATTASAPLRFYIDPQYALKADPTGATGMKRFLRVRMICTDTTKAAVAAFTGNAHPGI